MATALSSILIVIFCTFLGAFGPILLKRASEKNLLNPLELIKNWELFAGGSLYVLSTVLFIIALKNGEVSVLYPIVSITYIWIALLSMKFLGEKMNKWKWVGIGFIILGVSFIGFGNT